uniref:Integrase_SAM-like_N domain-containing protein n=1 Tax=Angiostrongylus cantonensis TaxID=6313 RepID=A0A158PCT1_ANGCA
MWCACTERNGTENECVRLGSGYSRQVAHRHNEFYGYLKLHVVPVFVTKEANQTDRSNLFSTPERAEEVESAIMRSPSEYNDGTPRTPLVEDDEENDDALEHISFLQVMQHLEEHLRFGHPLGEVGKRNCLKEAHHGLLPRPKWVDVLNRHCFHLAHSLARPDRVMDPRRTRQTSTHQDPMQLWHPGIPPFTTMPNPQTPHGDRSGSRTTSTAQLNPTSAPARNHPEREGGTKFVEIPPNTTPMKPGGLTPRRKRRSSRRDDSDLK